MKKRLWSAGVLILALAAGLAGILHGTGVQAQTGNGPAAFADPAFEQVWTRTDKLVQQGLVPRSWYWGPTPRTATHEPNQESPGGQRLVQYFDKSRMEINDPSADPNSAFYVTNGLLTVELISGNMQIGAQAFSQRYAACVNIAGDVDDTAAPTYNSFRSVSSVGGGIDHPDVDKRGQVAITTLDRGGNVGTDSSKSSMTGATYVYYEPATRHNIPQVFWQFLNQSGQVIENGQTVTRQLSVPWFYASGYPVSDAYWARVKIAGQFEDVLIQAFQRRVLTYTPNNQPAFQVEMGNIGLHYYDWRYNNAGQCPSTGATPTPVATAGATNTPGATATATATSTPAVSPTVVPLSGHIAWVSNRSGKQAIWTANSDGTTPLNLTAGSTANNYDPVYSPDGSKIAFASDRDGATHVEIYVMKADGTGQTRLTTTAAGVSNVHPTWRADALKIAYVSNQTGNNDIWVMNADGTGASNITMAVGNDHDPVWAGNNIVFVSNRGGSDQIYTMNPDGTAVHQITHSSGTNVEPTWSAANRRFLFISTRDGNPEIYVMNDDYSGEARVTTLLSNEYDPAWSPDAHYIIYTSDRDGNNEIYISYLDGSNLHRLTNDPGSDTHPTWR
jgi:Tol biopolymer transport system component